MKIARYQHHDTVHYVELEGDQLIPLKGELHALERDSAAATLALGDVKLLAPVVPSKVISLGPGHTNMLPEGVQAPERPFLFWKPTTALAHPEADILYPEGVSNILYEMEIALVIGKKATRVSQQDAMDYVLGFTCCNDVTAGSLKEDWGTQLSYHLKTFDTFCPLGPVITTDKDIDGWKMTSRLNGKVHADTKVSLIYSPADIVSWISHIMTLLPGDVIAMGAAAQADLKPGDTCEIEIENIGLLRNTVRALH